MTKMVFLLLFIGAIPWVSGMAQAQTEKELVAKGQYIFEPRRRLRLSQCPERNSVRGRSRFSNSFWHSLQHEYHTGQRDRSW